MSSIVRNTGCAWLALIIGGCVGSATLLEYLPLTSQFKEIMEQGHRALEERDSSRALCVLEVSRELAESLDDQRRLALIMNDPGEATLLSRQAVAIS